MIINYYNLAIESSLLINLMLIFLLIIIFIIVWLLFCTLRSIFSKVILFFDKSNINNSLEFLEGDSKKILLSDKLNNYINYQIKNKKDKEDVEYKSNVIAIDSEFGTGKTYFAKRLVAYLNKKYNKKTVYISIWEKDYLDNPIMAISQGISSLKGYDLTPIVKDFLKKTSISVNIAPFKFKTNIDLYKNPIEEFKEKVRKLKNKDELVIVIDELDRCRPDYAVKTLEIVKHLFNVEGITFIFMINKNFLRANINGFYNIDELYFEGKEHYLTRFFEIEHPLLEYNNYARDELRKKDYVNILNGYENEIMKLDSEEYLEDDIKSLKSIFKEDSYWIKEVEYNNLRITKGASASEGIYRVLTKREFENIVKIFICLIKQKDKGVIYPDLLLSVLVKHHIVKDYLHLSIDNKESQVYNYYLSNQNKYISENLGNVVDRFIEKLQSVNSIKNIESNIEFYTKLYQTYSSSTLNNGNEVTKIYNDIRSLGTSSFSTLKEEINKIYKEKESHRDGAAISNISKLEVFIEILEKYNDEDNTMIDVLNDVKEVLFETKRLYGEADIADVAKSYIYFYSPLNHFNK